MKLTSYVHYIRTYVHIQTLASKGNLDGKDKHEQENEFSDCLVSYATVTLTS